MAFQFREFYVADTEQPDFTAMTVQLLSAYFSNNQVPAGDIAGIIEATRGALERKATVETPATLEFVPAVSIRKSLSSREHIISMLDGKPYKTLKRHLATNGLTPSEYRERYNLPKDYPMIAPAYSEHRRAVAQQLGLGRRVGAKVGGEAPAVEAAPVAEAGSAGATPVVPEVAPATEATPAPVPEKKSRRSRVRAAVAKLGDEAGIAALEPTPEPVAAPAQPEGATAAKPAGKKAAAKKSTVKKAPAKPKANASTPAPAEEAVAAPATAEAAKPVARKKASTKASAVKAAPSTKSKAPRRRAATVKQDEAEAEVPAPAE
ncbi:MucR family transcriptional regulator [Sphingobium sp. SYK-6]|uniref:MucR family transcriptional regulator n=1 Tax=Sphingobium sp. (strain NBRC 103272 / SYK-6) TaxID=627192 RepID=UPI00022774F7|nr:MucR family transcriptional regulator [Sphingobium sp. SYK-6]BAK66630.1 MucR family transcriptional regulator [Sphingobium sp. SYK-6]